MGGLGNPSGVLGSLGNPTGILGGFVHFTSTRAIFKALRRGVRSTAPAGNCGRADMEGAKVMEQNKKRGGGKEQNLKTKRL